MKTYRIGYVNRLSIFTDGDGLIHINIGAYDYGNCMSDGEEVEMCVQDVQEIINDLKWLIKQVQ